MSLGAVSTSSSLPLILSAPPLGNAIYPFTQIRSYIPDRMAEALASPEHIQNDPAVRMISEARVGGMFWERSAATAAAIVVCVPPHAGHARQMWRNAKAWTSPDRLLLVTPHDGTKWRRMRSEARTEGAQAISENVDPHSLLDGTRTFLLPPKGLTTLSALAALTGHPVLRPDMDADWKPDLHASSKALHILHSATEYRSPFSGQPIDIVEAISLLTEWKRILMTNRTISVCVGMSFWKRARMGAFFATAEKRRPLPLFRRTTTGALTVARNRPGRNGIAVWATRLPRGLEQAARKNHFPLFRVEDGFIRSVGLGSGFLPPASIIADSRGAYYDPAQPSDLEVLLATHPLGEELQERARALTRLIRAQSISKYSAGGSVPTLGAPEGRQIILVPGQVADDMSVRLGGGTVAGNMDLLRRVRSARPDAFIVYRPHPDVDAGHRAGAIPDADVLQVADRISRGGGMAPLLDVVNEVHTLTSLTGFEALMRGLSVTTYGQPFYAGWGLTHDRAPVVRRTRRLNVAQLTAATLLLYPRYIDPLTGLFCGPEVLIDRFGTPEVWRPDLLMRLRGAQGKIRKVFVQGVHTVLHTPAIKKGRS
ncbi:capsular polysaccharide export protein, LipB/KpsS family [Gluconobacter thailandicus]|uniref:Capsular biosynthesis protein n=1 Tax=Gluconobacter thailandicus TaxID=257438 RepID=A0AAP9ERW9_GLUTH|nr:capsular biosynthesis protein [Gluconobacter thailandicus]QEH96059.1 capsular biosynthesis protein [Gluconobacter thailandicus]